MKRFLILFVAILTVTALAANVFESEAQPLNNNQFDGIAKYTNGNPAPQGALVEAFRGGVKVGEATVMGSNGYYVILGDDNDFPTANNYTLIADDQIGAMGHDQNVSHTIHTTTEHDIVLDIAY